MTNTLIGKTEEINEENGLPQGWVDIEVSFLGDVVTGTTPSKNNPDFYADDYPFYKPTDLDFGYYVKKATDNLSNEGVKKARLLKEKSTLVTCIGATIGKAGFIRNEGACNQQINAIIPSVHLYPEFIYFMCISPQFQKSIKDNASSTTLPILNKGRFEKLNFPLPPLPEQVRIVEKIEELFSNIDAGIEKLEQAKLQIKQYKQSVLKSAFKGKLYKTTEWEEVIISKVAEVNPKTELPDINDNEDVSFLPMPAVKAEINYYVEEKAKFGKVKKGYTRFQDNDVLFAKITPCMENGKSCVVKDLKYGVGFGSTEFHVIRCSEQLLSKFIFHFIVQENYRKTAKGFMSGAVGQQRVPKDYLQNTEFNLPKIEEQQKIVEEIEKRFEAADILEKAVIEGLEKSKQLKHSILKKAFEGRLVPQDPNDEPASILLEKIKAEKAAIESNAKQSKNKTKGGKNA